MNEVPKAVKVPTATSGRLSRIGMFVANHRRSLPIRKLAGLSRRYLSWYANVSYDTETNGESFVMRTVAGFRPTVFFDVGANVGDWSIAASSACPGVQIHAFEISPPTHKTLLENTQHLPGVRCHNVGMSDAPGQIKIRHYDGLPALTTATEYPHPFPFSEITAEVVRGDDYAASLGVQHIDLLKIDVEGMEPQVLRGFEAMLRNKRIDMVQFEYGRGNIVTRHMLRDICRFFEELGYVTGKIFPNYVDFRAYDLADEDFLGPNYLACNKEKTGHIAALHGVSGNGHAKAAGSAL